MLIHPGNLQRCENERYDKDVVEREALFNQKAGKEQQAFVHAFFINDKDAEYTGGENVNNAENQGVRKVGNFILAVEKKQIP